jgi:glucose/arabinose dehydrogenase
MARLSIPILLAGTLAIGGCGGSSNPESGGSQAIRGNERIGWDQQAANTAELSNFRYAIYVDGNRSELPDVTCADSRGSAGFACSGRLPGLSAGQHTLELASYVVVDGAVSESPKSQPIRVNVTSSLTAPIPSVTSNTPPSESRPPTSDPTLNALVSVQTIVDGLNDPVDLAFAPDGRLFVAERSGSIRIVRDRQVEAVPALVLDNFVAEPDARRVLSLALHPDFAATGFVYVLHGSEGRGGESVFRLSRYREAGGVLGERAVLLDEIPLASRAGSGSVRFGLDRRLYVAFDDGDDPARVGSAGTYSGKVLRLNDDGSTPDDQPAGTPVLATGLGSPCGLDWDAAGTLWIAECRGAGEGRLLSISARQPDRRARYQHAISQPLSGAVFSRGDAVPSLSYAMILATGEGLLRVRFDPRTRRVAGVDAFAGDLGAVRAVTVHPDGSLYAASGSRVVQVALPRR